MAEIDLVGLQILITKNGLNPISILPSLNESFITSIFYIRYEQRCVP